MFTHFKQLKSSYNKINTKKSAVNFFKLQDVLNYFVVYKSTSKFFRFRLVSFRVQSTAVVLYCSYFLLRNFAVALTDQHDAHWSC